MDSINLALVGLASLRDRLTTTVDLFFESRIFMVLLSCIMAVVFLVHVNSAVIILNNVYGLKSRRNLIHVHPSPINIVREITMNLQQSDTLHWNCYSELPSAVLLENNGRTVVMRICCSPGCTPYLSGGGLPGNYYYVETVFKWGTSEHSIDSRNYDLEMQVLHATNLPSAPYEYLTVSYLFALTEENNHLLDQVVDNLWAIRNPGSVVELPPFDLGLWMQCFRRNYYTYNGTYANGNVVLPSQWVICPRIFHLAPGQLAKFLALYDLNGHMIAQNSRKKQPLNGRSVALNC